jgi:hypothetical protein
MTEPSHEPEDFFVTSAYAPDGTKYSIQVVPVFSGTAPIMISLRDGPGAAPSSASSTAFSPKCSGR